MNEAEFHTGGCQCGAVRYRVSGPLKSASICFCRMCQKATGSPFGAFVSAPADAVTWTKNPPAYFQSSDRALRGFCRECGTPLTWEGDSRRVDFTLFSLDHPEQVRPTTQLFAKRKPAWLEEISGMAEKLPESAFAQIKSHQYPDNEA